MLRIPQFDVAPMCIVAHICICWNFKYMGFEYFNERTHLQQRWACVHTFACVEITGMWVSNLPTWNCLIFRYRAIAAMCDMQNNFLAMRMPKRKACQIGRAHV